MYSYQQEIKPKKFGENFQPVPNYFKSFQTKYKKKKKWTI